jgi:hypothetical protein
MTLQNSCIQFHYSRWSCLWAIICVIGALGLVGAMVVMLGEIGVRDLSYLKAWSHWMRGTFWMAISILPGVVLLTCYLVLRTCLFILLHHKERVCLDEKGITIIRGVSQMHFPWRSTSVCPEHLLSARISNDHDEYWISIALSNYSDFVSTALLYTRQA